MKIVCLIPARLQSTRLPRKLLLNASGKPLLQYVWETACRCPEFHDVVVATDSEEIAQAVHAFGGRAEMTGTHQSGTDRIAEVTRRCFTDADVVVNLQGDEPELEPSVISALVRQIADTNTEMATVAAPIRSPEIVRDPSCVKVVTDSNGRALYFSRSPIPFSRDASIEELFQQDIATPWLLHVGLYAYRRDFLLKLTTLAPSPLEQLEKLEQLRALQAGASIGVAVVNHAAVGIDTPEDYAAFLRRESARQLRKAA